MSTAEHFATLDRFPFCVPPVSDASSDTRVKIVDLNLKDAMRLFWNTESIRFSLTATGTTAPIDGSLTTTLDVEEIEIPVVDGGFTPKQRECRGRDVDTGYIIPCFQLASLSVPDAYTAPDSSTFGALFESFYFTREIYLQDDGLFTIIFWEQTSTDASPFYIAGLPDLPDGDFEYSGAHGEQDLNGVGGLTSGRIPYYLYWDPAGAYATGSVTFSLDFTFYTYA